MKNKILPLTVALCLVAHFAHAQNSNVTFNFRTIINVQNNINATGSNNSTTLNISAVNEPDAPAAPRTLDSTGLQMFWGYGSAFDTYYAFTFNETVKLESYTIGGAVVGSYTNNELYRLRIDSGGWVTEDAADNPTEHSSYQFANKLTINAGSTLYMGVQNSSNGELFWGSLTVTTVPEPATYALALAAFALVFVVLRRRR